ncbi:hypothetical protein SLA2020_304770 [Shorea laevis]
MGAWNDNTWTWNLQWRRQPHQREAESIVQLVEMLQENKPVVSSKDKWIWEREKDGKYSVKSTYKMLVHPPNHDGAKTMKKCWNPLAPKKVSAFMWQSLHRRIPTKDNLIARGILKEESQAICNMCGSCIESVDHLLLNCTHAYKLWTKCFRWWGLNYVMHCNFEKAFQQHGGMPKQKKQSGGWEIVWFAVVWSLWLCRNEYLFKNTEIDEEKLFALVQTRSYHWITGRARQVKFSLTDWITRPRECTKCFK